MGVSVAPPWEHVDLCLFWSLYVVLNINPGLVVSETYLQGYNLGKFYPGPGWGKETKEFVDALSRPW